MGNLVLRLSSTLFWRSATIDPGCFYSIVTHCASVRAPVTFSFNERAMLFSSQIGIFQFPAMASALRRSDLSFGAVYWAI
jgi:hypothetical protein